MTKYYRIANGFTYKCFVLFIVTGFFSMVSLAQSVKKSNVHIGLIYPISTNGTNAAQYSNHLSLHALVGVSRSETGFAAAGFGLVILDSAKGVQAAGYFNHIGKSASGAQLAGFVNHIRNEANGLTAAGFLNVIGTGNSTQLAGFGNLSLRGGNGNGVQLAGFINTAGDVHTQIAGFINVAKKVRGIQLSGFINIADSSEYPIGIVNIIKNGEKSLSVSIDETTTTLLSFRSGGRRLYGILGVGYNFKGTNPLYALEAGIGAHFPVSKNFLINTEAVHVNLSDFKKGDYWKAGLRVYPAFKLGERFELFGGPTISFVRYTKDLGKDLTDHYLWSETNSSNEFHGIFIGAIAGLQVKL